MYSFDIFKTFNNLKTLKYINLELDCSLMFMFIHNLINATFCYVSVAHCHIPLVFPRHTIIILRMNFRKAQRLVNIGWTSLQTLIAFDIETLQFTRIRMISVIIRMTHLHDGPFTKQSLLWNLLSQYCNKIFINLKCLYLTVQFIMEAQYNICIYAKFTVIIIYR